MPRRMSSSCIPGRSTGVLSYLPSLPTENIPLFWIRSQTVWPYAWRFFICCWGPKKSYRLKSKRKKRKGFLQSKMPTIIKNAKIVNANKVSGSQQDILIEHGKIVKIAASISHNGHKVLDAKGKLVLP